MPIAHYTRRILLAVVGLSPQVITETLYALAQEKNAQHAFIPTEIHLITTKAGAKLVQETLLDQTTGHYFQLLKDYPELGQPKFSTKQIHIVRDKTGKPLADIRSIADNTSVADTITTLLATLTADTESALHVSIAGGRKTMGFYLGYVFSLFARPQDQLSHVLVNPPFENHPDFFYPPKKTRIIQTHDGDSISTDQAKIELAKIPVVKLRYMQPKDLFNGQESFSDLIDKLQTNHEPPRLFINLNTQLVICGDTSITLPPALLAWLFMWAQRRKKNKAAINWRKLHKEEFLKIYARIVGINSASYENAKKRLKDGMDQDFFRQNNSKLKSILQKKLGPAATHYILSPKGERPYTQYKLSLQPALITLKN